VITELRRAILATTTIYLSLSALPHAGARAKRVSEPRIVISLDRSTLRLEPGSGKKRRVYPVAVGRRTPGGQKSPLGTWFTGPDPKDRELYLPSRREPAFHRGLPFLRLEIRRRGRRDPRRQERPFGIHGPVTPTLIWGTVTAGCIRMRPGHIRDLYRFAVRHPGMPVRVIRGPDRLGGRILEPDPERRARPDCPESALGVRRLRRIRTGRPLHDRICGVDHWYALELSGGDLVSVRLIQDGDLRVELFGIRAISAILAGRGGFDYKVPKVTKNRGDRYIRVVAPTGGNAAGKPIPYVLKVMR
jgi:hypothetical protein